jgi:hypothetical protein
MTNIETNEASIPIIVRTGMGDIREVKESMHVIIRFNRDMTIGELYDKFFDENLADYGNAISLKIIPEIKGENHV